MILIRYLFFVISFLYFQCNLTYSSESLNYFFEGATEENKTPLTFYKLNNIDLVFPEAILFDYDDTLVDSWPQALLTFNTCLENLGHIAMQEEDQYKLPNIPDTELLAQITGQPISKVEQIYEWAYTKHHTTPAPPIEGALELIEYLKQRNVYLAIISNKPSSLLHNTIRKLQWEGYFNKIVGAGDAEENKPSPKAVSFALEGSRIEPNNKVWFVGDSLTDMECSLYSGLSPIWLSQKATLKLNFSSSGLGIYEIKSLPDLISILKTI